VIEDPTGRWVPDEGDYGVEVDIAYQTRLDERTGRFGVRVVFGDHARVELSTEGAVAYAASVAATHEESVQMAAILAQNLALGAVMRDAVGMVMSMRETPDWPRLDHTATGPLRFEPFLAGDGSEPAVAVFATGSRQFLGRMDGADLGQHILSVLTVAGRAQLDSAYRQGLIGAVGADVNTATNAVRALDQFRDQMLRDVDAVAQVPGELAAGRLYATGHSDYVANPPTADLGRILARVPDGEHFWTAHSVFRIVDPSGRDGPLVFDRENLLTVHIGCLVCERQYTASLAALPCEGEPPE